MTQSPLFLKSGLQSACRHKCEVCTKIQTGKQVGSVKLV
jgi:hypothetical protein